MSRLKQLGRKLILPALAGSALFGLAISQTDEFEIAKSLELFSAVYKELNTYYVDEVNPEKLMRSGMDAMLGSLDPYTTYIPPQEVDQYNSNLTGRYAGLGGGIIARDGYLLITEVYEGSPSQKAGLKAGDLILRCDQQSLKDMPINEAVTYLRGAAGSKVKLEIRRPGQDKTFTVELKREEIKVNPVAFHALDDKGIAYIALTGFSENVSKDLQKILLDYKAQREVKGIILDLRGNMGGLLNEAVNVANLFLPQGEIIVQTRGRELESQVNYRALSPPLDLQTPLLVLIDQNSASASEIVAGAIQDFDRGIVLGRNSYGKGLVQQTRDLSFGAKLKVNVARYYIPSGRCIQARQHENGRPVQLPDSLRAVYKTKGGRKVLDGGGIKPDVLVERQALDRSLADLNKDFHLFDFATQYAAKQSPPAKAQAVAISEAVFEDFLKFLQNRNYSYVSTTEKLFRDFETKLKEEQYHQALNQEMQEIETLIQEEKTKLLRQQASGLRLALAQDLSRRWFFEKGAYEWALNQDPDILQAKAFIHEPVRYKSVLGQ